MSIYFIQIGTAGNSKNKTDKTLRLNKINIERKIEYE